MKTLQCYPRVPVKRVVAVPITDGPHETPEWEEDGIPFVSAEAVESGRVHLSKIRGFISRSEHTRFCKKCRPQNGDVFIVKSGATTGKVAYAEGLPEFNIWSPLALLRADEVEATGRFLFYAVCEDGYQTEIRNQWSYGTQPNIGMGVLSNIAIALPSLPLQKAIANFLDRKTAAIDALIEKKQKLLELLAEKRAAVINQAVTKGLDPTVPMKDSGIPWIGEIPAHWTVSALKRACLSVRDGTHAPPPRVDSGIHRLLSARNIQRGQFITLDDDRRLAPEAFAELERSYTVRSGDVVLACVGATTGKSAVVGEISDVSVQRSLAILRPDLTKVRSQYLNLWIGTPALQYSIQLKAGQYAAQGGIYLDDVANLPLVRPSIREQDNILSELEPFLLHYSSLEARLQASVSSLQEYRQALITAAVTGQFDIPPEPS